MLVFWFVGFYLTHGNYAHAHSHDEFIYCYCGNKSFLGQGLALHAAAKTEHFY